MAWDFSTNPEFEEHLEWMRSFVREEIWPIEAIENDIDQAQLDRIYAPLQERVKERGLWAAHLPPELGGQGFGHLKLGLMHEILGTSFFASNAFGCQAPDSGNSEILAIAGTPEQKERWLHPLLAGELKSAFSMTEPETPGSDPTQLRTRAVRDGDGYVLNGHKWFTSNGSIADFLIVMAVTDPDAAPHMRASMFIVPANAPGVNMVRDVANMEHPYQHYGMLGGHTEIYYEDVRLGPDALLGNEGEGFVISQQRLVPGRIHHCMRWLGLAQRAFDMMCERSLLPARPRRPPARQADGAELDRGLRGRDAGGAADDAARRVEDRPVRVEGGADRRLADQVLRRDDAKLTLVEKVISPDGRLRQVPLPRRGRRASSRRCASRCCTGPATRSTSSASRRRSAARWAASSAPPAAWASAATWRRGRSSIR